MNASTEPVRDEQERRDLFAAYLNLPQLHRWGFEEILKRPLVLGCLRNSLEAMRRRLAKRKVQSAPAIADFQLTP
jgi:hypothetical protein